eukprot:TRINITY_DN77271_c0_g1_i1.p1 TRINITY_DN77271_c0_g1~~TRINITY_DN77271_c0_g1_i1.p1  ORF type:complete len:607 (-),score=57.52 TRINITY_DN77271_c0_g1_i1:94-1878(-)
MGDAVSTANIVGSNSVPDDSTLPHKTSIVSGSTTASEASSSFTKDDRTDSQGSTIKPGRARQDGDDAQMQMRHIDAALARSQNPHPPNSQDHAVELFGVIRHAERADMIETTVDGKYWHDTADFRIHPNDPPLSDTGRQEAVAMADTITCRLREMPTAVQVIVTSPYFRCVQTACTIAQRLEGPVRLMIDFSLAELYGPEVFGDIPPSNTVRNMEELLAYAGQFGLEVIKAPVGVWPSWPETLSTCRKRYMERLLVYLMRGERTRRNFLLVSHADCVGAALAIMPSQGGRIVEKVGSGGMLLASRQFERKPVEKVPAGFAHQEATLSSTLPTTHPEVGLLDDQTLSKAQKDLDKADRVPSKPDNSLPQVGANLIATPWSVDTWNVVFGDFWCDGKASAVKNAMNALALSVHGNGKKRATSQKAVEALLGVLPSERSCGVDSNTACSNRPEVGDLPYDEPKARIELETSQKPARRLSWKLNRQGSGTSGFGRKWSCDSSASDISYETYLFGYPRLCSPQGDDETTPVTPPALAPGKKLSTIDEGAFISERSISGTFGANAKSPALSPSQKALDAQPTPKLNLGLSNLMNRRRGSR